MKKNNSTSFIIIAGVVVLCVFAYVAVANILPKNNESSSYYVKVEDGMSAKIEGMEVANNKLTITTSGDAVMYCVKSTKTTPSDNNICWQNIENNTASISVYAYKKYYVWIKDSSGNISSPLSINTKEN